LRASLIDEAKLGKLSSNITQRALMRSPAEGDVDLSNNKDRSGRLWAS
jgi:hypothetical protein